MLSKASNNPPQTTKLPAAWTVTDAKAWGLSTFIASCDATSCWWFLSLLKFPIKCQRGRQNKPQECYAGRRVLNIKVEIHLFMHRNNAFTVLFLYFLFFIFYCEFKVLSKFFLSKCRIDVKLVNFFIFLMCMLTRNVQKYRSYSSL